MFLIGSLLILGIYLSALSPALNDLTNIISLAREVALQLYLIAIGHVYAFMFVPTKAYVERYIIRFDVLW